MRHWIPAVLYDAKPWALAIAGAILLLGSLYVALSQGHWTVLLGLLCFAGAALLVGGGVLFQLRMDYRARSKWRREGRR